jgi:Tfp pilus assembly protein PilE
MLLNNNFLKGLELKKFVSAYTIIELVIVTVMLLTLGSIALVKYGSVQEKARSAEAYSVLAEIAAAESAYDVDNTGYTSNFADLDRYDSAPASDNFDFTEALNDIASGYVKAVPRSGKGTVTYYLCIKGGVKGTSAPSCP